jgi:glycosyltransferase involved in cell wall biosynthesis
MKVGVIIPTRGDRPLFLKNCIRLLQNQTLTPHLVAVIDHEPASDDCDITKRYRAGYDRLRDQDLDVIALMEDDDWYAPDYLELMCNKWAELGRPDLLGTDYTIYYHIKLFAHFTMYHDQRGSAMGTLIKPDMDFNWCHDSQPYTDSHLWVIAKHQSTGRKLNGKIFKPAKHICMGIKHGVGMRGGDSHLSRLDRYTTNTGIPDYGKSFLKSIVDPDSFQFYSNYFTHDTQK